MDATKQPEVDMFTGHEVATKVTPTECKYHKTVIASLLPTGKTVLRTGGWYTVTTKRRMNQFADTHKLAWRVFQENFEWFVWYFATGKRIPFYDGMEV